MPARDGDKLPRPRWCGRFAIAVPIAVVAIAVAGCGRSSVGMTRRLDGGILVGGDGTGSQGEVRGGLLATDALGGDAGELGTTGAPECAEPIPCKGYDDSPDAHAVAVISCLSPSTAFARVPLSLAIYGHHLAIDANGYSIVTFDDSTVLNGVPVSACHLEVEISAAQMPSSGRVAVVVSPGGWTTASAPAVLTIR